MRDACRRLQGVLYQYAGDFPVADIDVIGPFYADLGMVVAVKQAVDGLGYRHRYRF